MLEDIDRMLAARNVLLGEHNDEILTEVGYSGDEIGALRAAGAV